MSSISGIGAGGYVPPTPFKASAPQVPKTPGVAGLPSKPVASSDPDGDGDHDTPGVPDQDGK